MKNLWGKIKIARDIILNVKNWPIVFSKIFKIIKSNVILFSFRNGLTLKIEKAKGKYETSGLATIWEIIIKRNYTPKGFEIKPEDCVIDIGANIGIFSLYAAKRAYKGKVYSYEPFNPHYNRFVKNISLNNLSNVKAFNLAISKKEGMRNLFISKISSGMHSLLGGAKRSDSGNNPQQDYRC